MQTPAEELQTQTQDQLEKIFDALESGAFQPIRRMLNGLRPVEIAHLLESSPPKSRIILWQLVDKELEGEVLQEMSEDVRGYFLRRMDFAELAAVTESLDDDDVTDILQQLPDRVIRQVLAAMSEQNRLRVESLLSYSGDTAGGLMSSDLITVRPRLTLDVVLRYLRRHDELPSSTDSLIVVNRDDQFLGLLPISKLLTTDPSITVREVMVTDVEPIRADMFDSEVARLFEYHDWISAPVVDDSGKVLGRITIDDVVDVIREDADHSLMSMAGLDAEEATFAPVLKTTPRRALWLGINLVTAVIASVVIHFFEGTIQKVVALAVLMPIVASMGGVAGSQTLTVVIRGMALQQIGRSNISWLLSREFVVSALNGLFLAIVLGVAVSLFYDDLTIAFIIAGAMIINLITAAMAGTLLPMLLRRVKVDPALAGGVLLTTVTDVVGFLSFLGLATLFYA
ncbi:magnesium transporter [Gilvimarinus sp. F26214L]|uniref:magnesium transporter n=1 Tax=Gilvimarinus sp. DZF01 TaxID=3461371 RepID=UPI00404520D4